MQQTTTLPTPSIPLRPDAAAAITAARSAEYAARSALVPAPRLAPAEARTAPDTLRLVYLVPRTDVGGGARVLFEHANRLTAQGHEVTVLSHFDQPSWFDLRADYRRVPFGLELADAAPACDVIIAGYWDQILAARALGVAPVVHFEQGDFHLFEEVEPGTLAFVRKSLEAADATMTVSGTVAEVLRTRYGVEARVVHNAVDRAVFAPADSRHVATTRPYVLCVGWDGNEFKGIAEMRRIWQQLRADGRDLELVWVTPRPPREPLGQVVVSPDQATLGELYRNAAVYVCCSHYESFPLPPLEAMASGTPVVATRNVGVLEYARDGVNALLADVRDVDGLTAAIRRVLDDADLAERLRSGGLATAGSFSWDAIVERLVETYRETTVSWTPPPADDTWRLDLDGLRFDDPQAEVLLRRRAAAATTARIAVPVSFPAFEGHRAVRWQVVGGRRNGTSDVTRVYLPAHTDEPPRDLPYLDALREFRAERFDAALERFVHAYQRGDEATKTSVARWLVLTLLELGRDREATQIALGGVENHPDHSDFHYLYAMTAMLSGLRVDGAAYVAMLDALGPATRFDEWFDDPASLARERLLDPDGGAVGPEESSVLLRNPEPSQLQARHDPYFVQQLRVSNELAGVPRVAFFRQVLAGKRVLHVGYADWPITDPARNLHVQLDAVCAQLDGVDPNDEAAAVLGPMVRGRLFSDWAQVSGSYDVVLVPEVLEHVGDVPSFFAQLDSVDFGEILITVPDAFQCRGGHFEYDATTQAFTEVVHPDHNYWFTPYTFYNVVTKHTDWVVDGMWFFNGISLLLAASKPRG